jgi:hypothetical protein
MDKPEALTAELVKMRRNPANLTIGKVSKCKFCTGKESGYHVLNAEFELIGFWCSVHGWLYFDSVGNPPTERLTASEIEDQRVSEQRRRRIAQKKADQP